MLLDYADRFSQIIDDPEVEKLYLVLEYVAGGCIMDARSKQDPLPLNLALYFPFP